ncbi:HAMP domain-containing protein [Thiohalocapsa marina]|uniref:histidine kinase n=1 Tax=Thiohalocapsa marina TaxID=424902 RepID=A0A5M8FNS8_9GAMM|nr:ATP-binding protein [Thiohalocapsa marina]KAA6185316.1 HAMP domain-containing protein [Thiohalocapsa marina]
MLRRLSLRQQNALRLALIFVLFELLAAVAVVFLLMLPMAQRASGDLTGLMVLAAQTWSELPPGTRPAFEQELLRAHGLTLSVDAPAQATPPRRHGLYLRALQARLNQRVGQAVSLLDAERAGERWLWAALPSGGQSLWLGFSHGRVGPHPLAALVLTLTGGFVLAAVAAWWLGGYILAPIRRFDAAAATLGRGETPTQLPEEGPLELAGLAHRFNLLSRQIRDLLEARTTLLAGLSHDLRTPLARMRLALEMLQRRPDPTWIERLDRDITEMDRLVADVLTLARGLSHAEAEPVELSALLEEIADAARSGGADVQLHCAPAELRLPVEPLRRVLGNLIDNARRYAAGHPLELRAECADGGCRIGVLDRGPGIPEAELDAVFRPFHRVEHSRSPVTGGTGLGLAIVRQLAQVCGWRVWLENRPDGGLAAWLQVIPAGDG